MDEVLTDPHDHSGPGDPVTGAADAAAPVGGGAPGTVGPLVELFYRELRQVARLKLKDEPPNQTLQATALVHEAYLRLAASGGWGSSDRRYFFAAAAQAMRRILIDNARRKSALRHGGGLERMPLDAIDPPVPLPDEQWLALDAALERFTKIEPVKAELVKLKFFAGLTTAEAACMLDLSEPTAKRHWAFARAWLYREMTGRTGA